MKKKILLISFSCIASESRLLREYEFLKKSGFQLTVIGISKPVPGMDFIPVKHYSSKIQWFLNKVSLLTGMYSLFTRQWQVTERDLQGKSFDLIIVHDIFPMPLATRLSKRFHCPMIWNAHEFYPEELSSTSLGARCSNHLAKVMCRTFLPRYKLVNSVCPAICKRYQQEFHLPEEPLLIRNIPVYQELAPAETRPDKIRMIHHGGINRDRKIELMIDAMALLDERFTLDLMLMHNASNQKYYDFITAKAAGNPRIRLLNPVPQAELVRKTNEYDLGLYLMAPTNYNTAHALPNKLFEYLQSRLAVAIGPSPEMAAIVKQYDVGIVSEDFSPESLASVLNKLTFDDILRFKRNADLAAHELCAEKEMPKLIEKIKEILK